VTQDLFNLLTDNVEMTYVDIDFENLEVVFKQASGHKGLRITVKANHTIDRDNLIKFLAKPDMVDFGSESWLFSQLKTYKARVVLYVGDDGPAVDTSLSR
jgi:hypothetical protein